MKRFYFILLCLCVSGGWFGINSQTAAQIESDQTLESNRVSPSVVISQFQTNGNFDNDEFIELHNNSSTDLDLNGFQLVYRSTAGTNDIRIMQWTTRTIISAGGYYLVASNAYDGSATPNIIFNTSACACGLSASGGGLAIRNGALNSGVIFDAVGYGSATNAFVEGTRTAAPATNGSQSRINNGCQDTDVNANDFSAVNPAAPRNSSNVPNLCSGGGSTLLIGGGANPNAVAPGAATLFTVSVQPATTPPSTGIAVTGNLSGIGGAANQQFYDDGTNGDVTAGDNTFSFSATIPAGASGGNFIVSATATDAQMRSATVNISITVNAPAAGENYLLLGNPSNATSDAANENNYLMNKPQYSLSYNRSRAIPNWVSWRLDSTWLSGAPRQDDFRPDTTLPLGYYQVTDGDYSGSGFNRGHHTPSGDRTRTIADNSATFLMTNMMPQAGGNNQGPWEKLETYCRSLAGSGNELYIITGGAGQGGTGENGFRTTIANGRVVVPAQTWKVILVLPNGNNDLERINNSTRTIAVIMPNIESIRFDAWETYAVTVDQVESLTGFDFFSNVPVNTQSVIESRIGGAPTAANVSISGHVITPEQLGLTNALVTLTDSQGTTRTILTGKFGSFRFNQVAVGETYVLSVASKRYFFEPRVITPTEDLTELTFTP